MLLNFLHNMPPRWKDKYVKRIITLATPWAGSVRAIQALSIGYNLGNSFINSQKMKEIEKTYPSIVWLIPSEKFWKSHDVIVSMNNKNYTTRNIEEFLYDIGESTVVEMKKDLLPYNNFTAPGVETHCLFGNVNGSVVGRYSNNKLKINVLYKLHLFFSIVWSLAKHLITVHYCRQTTAMEQ